MSSASMQDAVYSGPPAYVPVSGWAVTALVLAIVLGLPALFGIYWPEALPLVIVILAWGSMSSRRRRGMGVAIAAGVIALLAGGYGFVTAKLAAAALQSLLEPVLKGAEAGDKAMAERWLLPSEDAAARAESWKKRFAAAQERVGKWTGTIEAGNFWAGPVAMVAPPSGVEEVPPLGEGSVGLGDAIWVRAVCEKGPVWIAIQAKADKPGTGFSELAKSVQHNGKEDDAGLAAPKAIKDLRFYVPTGAGK
jgi:hypothetical protein